MPKALVAPDTRRRSRLPPGPYPRQTSARHRPGHRRCLVASLQAMAGSYSTAAVSMGHLALKRAIRFAAARDLGGRNVAELSDTPPGRPAQQIPHPRPGRRAPQRQYRHPDRRLHRAQPRHRDPHRGSTRPALGRRRLRRPARRSPHPAPRRGMAVSAPQRRHQDPQLTPHPAHARIRRRGATRPARARRPGHRPGVRHQRRQPTRRRQRPPRVPRRHPHRRHRRHLDNRGDRAAVSRNLGRDPSWPPNGGPFSGATIEWSYPDHLHERALTRVAAVRHAISVLLDDLQGSTPVDAQ